MEPYGADEGVQVGSMLFTLVDPTRGHEVAYNNWYERDHFYSGCMVGPWLFAGARWVATRELKDLRFPEGVDTEHAVAEPIDAGSYLATYFVHKGHEAEHFAWANRQVFELYSNGRGFEERQHAHTSLYFITDSDRRTESGVPAHMALDHPYKGLVSIHVDRPDGTSQGDLVEWFRESGNEALFGDGPDGETSAVDQVLHWRPVIPKGEEGNAPMKLGSGPGTRQRSMQLLFLTDDPRNVWDRVKTYASALQGSGMGDIRLVAPFIPTVPGTDKYTDELW
ncbi:MAG: hypothetical protein WBA45_08140 [Microthrixaceae bacterium]